MIKEGIEDEIDFLLKRLQTNEDVQDATRIKWLIMLELLINNMDADELGELIVRTCDVYTTKLSTFEAGNVAAN
jgi:hypothetical protein